MTRRVVETGAATYDREHLTIITIYEEGANKEKVKKLSGLSKRHGVLVKRNNRFEFKDN